jgi:hypothetical protein
MRDELMRSDDAGPDPAAAPGEWHEAADLPLDVIICVSLDELDGLSGDMMV